MSKNILLPTDFSDNALSAAIYAIKLYEKEPCTFHLLHSSRMKISRMSNISNKLIQVLAENARRELDHLKAKVTTDYANENHTFEVILSTNDLQDSIEAIVEKTKIDLIVIGSRGETKANDIIFGNNTVNVITHVKKCPVLVVPNDYDFVTPERIAFPTDFNRVYGDELQPLILLAELNNSNIKVVHINTEDKLSETQKENLDTLEVALENHNPSYHWMPKSDRKAKAIQDFNEEFHINILVMVNYQHSFIESIIKEPVIKTLGFHPNIPFLVIPQK
ncbi:universal stress protein [Winogradskyella psychrotolerans]|uniref:universal stress protein n=1 Tax=Winogradskyella psychrotolerans TaxID=1344585 RepID=UPI001C06E5AE|nr:universal stress protein [Winogradskyella psychrotolerans]MBU2927652.1 universal stress protein [Winogradskyella psychrotolerans]